MSSFGVIQVLKEGVAATCLRSLERLKKKLNVKEGFIVYLYVVLVTLESDFFLS